jgi:hypothetical protein
MATDLYRRAMAYDYGDAERAALMREVWDPTPWIIDAYTGCDDGLRELQILRWCRNEFGDESSPIHGRTAAGTRAAPPSTAGNGSASPPKPTCSASRPPGRRRRASRDRMSYEARRRSP